MIRYALKCDQDHSFESWFKSAEAFDRLHAARQVACPVCGSAEVAKMLMAPAVRPARKTASAPQGDSAAPALSAPQSDIETAMATMRRAVEENSDYVGMNFAAEARAMHEGTTPERPIYGEAKPEEARALLEEGVPVLPLPFVPKRKTN